MPAGIILHTLCLHLHIHRFKSDMNDLLLQNVPHPPSTSVMNSVLMFECLQNHQVKVRKQFAMQESIVVMLSENEDFIT